MAKKVSATEKLTVFLTPDDMRRVQALAEDQGLSMSAYVRAILRGRLNYTEKMNAMNNSDRIRKDTI